MTRPWRGFSKRADACDCGAGAPCEACNSLGDADHAPDVSRTGVAITADGRDPAPGSPAARASGCTCPPMGGASPYRLNDARPLHGIEAMHALAVAIGNIPQDDPL
jgi:hypothetical protein